VEVKIQEKIFREGSDMPEMEQRATKSTTNVDVPRNLKELNEGELTGIYYSLLAFKDQHPDIDRVSKEMSKRNLL